MGGRIGNRQAQRREADEARVDVVEAGRDGLELTAHFAGEDRRVIRRTWSFCILHSAFCIHLARPPAGTSRESAPLNSLTCGQDRTEPHVGADADAGVEAARRPAAARGVDATAAPKHVPHANRRTTRISPRR